ncbi:hypothetical protein GOP47_0025098 [Adiantum capillus-veneris]|uniref:Uncharacterized protein n=1 Tax=Adiantum capillus-veneris TaxID=13818 RepID=A0A9D4U469_ADICA|nr:hypothetical protein GOP47_0025098 [Adiantum capillus-veneris]
MSTRSKGPPKHQNRKAWKANAGVKKNDKELGGKLCPYPEITGVCPRCKAQIEWRRKYGKYKALTEPAKCNHCSKRAVRQAYHALCAACAKERNVCAKCCQPSETIVGKDAEKHREEQQMLEQALRNLRERDRRTLLRAMNNGTSTAELRKPGKEGSLDDKSKLDEDSEIEDEDECDSLDATEDGSDEDDIELGGSAASKLQVQHLELS